MRRPCCDDLSRPLPTRSPRAEALLAAETARRDQLQQALAVATLRYEAGRTSFLEVLDAQRTLLAAETLRIAAAY